MIYGRFYAEQFFDLLGYKSDVIPIIGMMKSDSSLIVAETAVSHHYSYKFSKLNGFRWFVYCVRKKCGRLSLESAFGKPPFLPSCFSMALINGNPAVFC